MVLVPTIGFHLQQYSQIQEQFKEMAKQCCLVDHNHHNVIFVEQAILCNDQVFGMGSI